MKILAVLHEAWKPIPGFSGYEVSSLGRVRTYWHRVVGGARGEYAVGSTPKLMRTLSCQSLTARIGCFTATVTRQITMSITCGGERRQRTSRMRSPTARMTHTGEQHSVTQSFQRTL